MGRTNPIASDQGNIFNFLDEMEMFLLVGEVDVGEVRACARR